MYKTYEYVCEACEHEFEELQTTTKAQKKCPECGKLKLRRKPSMPALHMRYSLCHPRVGRGLG